MTPDTDLAEYWYKLQGVNPEPWEAAEGSVGRKSNKTFVQFRSTLQMRTYQESVKQLFPQQNPDAGIHEGLLDIKFFFWRQIAVLESENGKRGTRAHVADATNLQKCLEDALQKILYLNDRDNRRVSSEIVAQGEEVTPFILVRITRYRPDPAPVLMRSDLEEEEPTPSSNRREVPKGIF